MAILVSLNVEKNNSGTLSAPRTTLYGIPFITLVRANGAGSTLIVKGLNGPEEVIVSQSYASVDALINAGYLDFSIPLTVNSVVGIPRDTYPYAISLRASNIVEVYANPQNASESVVTYRDEESPNDRLYIVNEDLAAISALLPVISTGDGNGIYTSSGSLPAPTVVTMATNNMRFDSSGQSGLFSIDAVNDRVGIGTESPGYSLQVESGDFFVKSGVVGINESPDSTTNLRVTSDGGTTTAVRADLSYLGTGTYSGFTARRVPNYAGATSTVFGVNSLMQGTADAGAHKVYGGSFRAESVAGVGTIDNIGIRVTALNGTTNYALQLQDGTEGAGKVLTSDATGRTQWANPAASETLSATLTAGDTTADGQTFNSLNGSGQLDLRYGGTNNQVALSNDAGGFSNEILYLSDNFVELSSYGSATSSVNFYTDNNRIEMTESNDQIILRTGGSAAEFKISPIHYGGGANGVSVIGTQSTNPINAISFYTGNNTAGAISTANQDVYPTLVSARNSTVNTGLDNVAVVGATGITAKVSNALYTSQLRMQDSITTNDGIFTSGILTADRTYSFPDADMDFSTAITETLNFGGGGSGDVATLTITNGIVTARTLVP